MLALAAALVPAGSEGLLTSAQAENTGAASAAAPEMSGSPISRDYPWLTAPGLASIEAGIAPPPGYARVPAQPGSFGAWLRGLPLCPGRPAVLLYDGTRKANQNAHFAVLEIDVGTRDLQQCADAVIRLRAEYLFARGCEREIAFSYTNGTSSAWVEWRDGLRPEVRGERVLWNMLESPDGSYANFRRYLDAVFTYAGSASLARDLLPVADPGRPELGDVLIKGGFPGHAVLVVDLAANEQGERVFLLAQSFMPAQEIHILKSPAADLDPWYPAAPEGLLRTPEWDFAYSDLRRFKSGPCERQAVGVAETGVP